MQHSIFDRIYLAFLFTLIASFAIIIAYTTFASKSALTQEKEDTLTNEAQLIASQTLDSYVAGTFDAAELSTLFTYYAEVLNAVVSALFSIVYSFAVPKSMSLTPPSGFSITFEGFISL